jgi:hypothetical protein
MWTPWEPVSAEIEGDHLAPVVWRDRLYLFWVTFLEKAKATNALITVDYKTPISIPSSVEKEIEAQLHWSEYLQGEWKTRESGEFDPPDSQKLKAISVNPKRVFIFVSKEDDEDGEERGVYIHLSWPFNQAFYLAGRNSSPEKSAVGPIPSHPYTPGWGFETANATRYTGDGPLKVTFASRITTTASGWAPGAVETPSILQQGNTFTLLPCDNDLTALGVSEEAYKNASNPSAVKAALERGIRDIAALMKPVFYQDNRHTFFVEPEVTERTIEEWEEWVTRTPQPDPGWQIPDWWKDIVVIPDIPQKWPLPDPGDPWRFPIDPDSLINPVLDRDWLVNPGTVLKFDGVLISAAGQSGIEIQPLSDTEISQAQLSVNPGSDLGSDGAVVLRDESAFAMSGIKVIGGGLNIVGGAGFNSALEKNFNALNRSGFGAGVLGAVRMGR